MDQWILDYLNGCKVFIGIHQSKSWISNNRRKIYIPVEDQGGLFDINNHYIDLIEDSFEKNTNMVLNYDINLTEENIIDINNMEISNLNDSLLETKSIWYIYDTKDNLLYSGILGEDDLPTNLSSGNYIIKIKTTLTDGRELEKEQEFTIKSLKDLITIELLNINKCQLSGNCSFTVGILNDSDIYNATINWGDGTSTILDYTSNSNENYSYYNIDHNFTNSGSYNIVVSSNDTNFTATININISNNTTTTLLKKTGQTVSYDENGNEVTDGSIKDDGYYQAGVSPNYERDDDKEIVIDHITGLMWQDNAEVEYITKPWLTEENYDKCEDGDDSACYDTSGDTATTYCENLTLGGYSNWRLPTRKELVSIVDYGRYDPAIDPKFEYFVSYGFWSSTTYANFHGYSWVVYFWSGYQYDHGKGDSRYVLVCERESKKMLPRVTIQGLDSGVSQE